MKTDAERGADGLWLRTRRGERGYRNAELARKAIQATGTYIPPSVYAEYESGRRRISDRHRPILEAFWGPPSKPPEAPEVASLLAAMTRALEAQADAFMALRLSLDQARAEAIGGREATTDQLAVLRRELAAIRSLVESGAADGPPPPGVPVP